MGPVESTFLKWLRSGLPGCKFAQKHYSKEARIVLPLVGPDLQLESLEAALDGYSRRGVPVVALLPWVREEADLIEVIAALARSSRWRCTLVEDLPIAGSRTCVSIAYQTRGPYVSEAMGFAPLLSMPTTRRAPCVGLGAWAGGRENPFAPVKRGPADLSFLDMPHILSEDDYRALFAKSTAMTKERLENPMFDPPEDARHYRRVAFALSGGARALLVESGLTARSPSPRTSA